jgi:hypothetical protein
LLYEFVIRLFGAGLASTLYFFPLTITYSDECFTIQARLNEPLTNDIEALMKRGFDFRIEYSYTIIINDRRSYTATSVNTVAYQKQWLVNDSSETGERLQECAGGSHARFFHFKFDEGDKVFVFVNAHIVADEVFTQSTGLPTSILWSYYVPRTKETFRYSRGAFVKE